MKAFRLNEKRDHKMVFVSSSWFRRDKQFGFNFSQSFRKVFF